MTLIRTLILAGLVATASLGSTATIAAIPAHDESALHTSADAPDSAATPAPRLRVAVGLAESGGETGAPRRR